MEVDLELVQNRKSIRVFIATNPDGSVHPILNSTVEMTIYKPSPTTDVTIVGAIGGVDNNEISITFDVPNIAELGLFEYELWQLPNIGDPIWLGRGNITWVTQEDFTTQTSTLVEKEALGLTIDEDFKTQSILYWRHYLQPQFEIPDASIYDDSAWPILTRFLIAKLVVHDYLVVLMKGSIASSFNTTESTSSSSGSGALKKLETGPSNAEWYDTNESLTKVLTAGSGGTSAFDQLNKDICNLASRVRAYLPMCGIPDPVIVLPVKAEGVTYINRAYSILVLNA